MKNRVIKFRAWDKSIRQMYYNSGLTISENNIIHMDGEIMQFTGLKDKNGREIYEGDVVEFSTFNDHVFGNDTYKSEMVFADNGFYLRSKAGLINPCNSRFVEFFVIGNIYKNPELLTSEQTKEQ